MILSACTLFSLWLKMKAFFCRNKKMFHEANGINIFSKLSGVITLNVLLMKALKIVFFAHQRIQFFFVINRQFEEPCFDLGVGIDQRRVLGQA